MIATPLILHRVHLFRNLVSSILKRYARLFRPRYLVERRMGVLLLLDQKNSVDGSLLFRGFWEPEQLKYLSNLILRHRREKEEVVFLDIGSHAGLYSIVLDSKINLDAILAFEPVPSNLAQLRANLLMNNCLSRIQVFDKAVSDKEGSLGFVIATDKNRGMSRIMENDINVGETVIDVDVTSIDRTVDYSGKLIVAKIDVEGGELGVIRGMEKTLTNNRVILQIECNRGPLTDLKDLLSAFDVRLIETIGEDYFFIKV
jgi:FkbM family methyltransferase